MKDYYVQFINPEVGYVEWVKFSADDFAHAEEQMIDYDPEAEIHTITLFLP